ncbi:MAG: type II toxin-antitoxin system ParD family antitoxin [Chloroflexota bacterium]
MHLKLPEKLEAYTQSQVESGIYSSASEFIRELIRNHMLAQEKEALRANFYNGINVGDTQLLNGEGIEYSHGYLNRLNQIAQENVAKGRPTDRPDVLPR